MNDFSTVLARYTGPKEKRKFENLVTHQLSSLAHDMHYRVPFRATGMEMLAININGQWIPAFSLYTNFRRENPIMQKDFESRFHMSKRGMIALTEHAKKTIEKIEKYSERLFLFNTITLAVFDNKYDDGWKWSWKMGVSDTRNAQSVKLFRLSPDKGISGLSLGKDSF